MSAKKKTASDLGTKSETNNIKVDENAPIETFGDGAIRSSKAGKGRYDLIPNLVIADLLEDEIALLHCNDVLPSKPHELSFNIIKAINHHDWVRAIWFLTLSKYGNSEIWCIDAFNNMQVDLAKHYENGAEIYGENNWKHGIPKWSFISSGTRHAQQYINGLTDEPHCISAIWNFVNALWCEQKERYGFE